MTKMTAEIYIGMNNWNDVNWYLQQGYFIKSIQAITFPGYFTILFDLSEEGRIEELRNLVLKARKSGIKITCNRDDMLDILNLEPIDGSEENKHVISAFVEPKKEDKKEDEEKSAEILEARREQLNKCNRFFMEVAALLTDTHRIIGSTRPGVWKSACLIPIGTEDQLTYYSKPQNSLRVACNWNWRASLKKCDKPEYIQCCSYDMPWPRSRPKDNPEGASSPIWGNMVGYFDKDQKYHCVFGERFDRKTRKWIWKENTPQAVARMMLERVLDEQANEALNMTMEEIDNEI